MIFFKAALNLCVLWKEINKLPKFDLNFVDGYVILSHCDSVIHIYSLHFKQFIMQSAENSNQK